MNIQEKEQSVTEQMASSVAKEVKPNSISLDVKGPEQTEPLSPSKHTDSSAKQSSPERSGFQSEVLLASNYLHSEVPASDHMIKNKLSEEKSVEKIVVEDAHHQPHYDGMPSFDEWKKMMLAEQEKGGQQMPSPNPPGKKISSQKRRRNYSSYECGAKIVASNSEAEGTSRILNELVDEYMLNPCKAKIWFVIELCETVQASQIELANFELFSSCPKDFAVYSSDNFPTRDWILLGTFSAVEQRVLQSFELKQEGFGKFIKIELLSHYGGEHYCPLSVVRIFGTSMVDEYEEMETLANQVNIPDDELDRLDIPVEDQKESTNLFGSATDAVLSIVKKAAQALGQQQALEEGQTNETAPEQQNVSDAKLCKLVDRASNKCDDHMLSDSENIGSSIEDLPLAPSSSNLSLFRLLQRCDQCVSSRIRYYSSAQPHCRFFQAALGPVVFQKLCDWFKEHPLVITHETSVSGKENAYSGSSFVVSPTKSPPPQIMRIPVDSDSSLKKLIPNDSFPSLSKLDKNVNLNISDGTLRKLNKSVVLTDHIVLETSIHPTRTQQNGHSSTYSDSKKISEYDQSSGSSPLADSVVELPSKVTVPLPEKTDAFIEKSPTETLSVNANDNSVLSEMLTDSEEQQITDYLSESSTTTSPEEEITDTVSPIEMPTNNRTGDEKRMDMRSEFQGKHEPITASGVSTAGQKESVFMRMSNRIKALEINMSLSSQYLQELSQRYRRQMEEMQRAFNRTIGTLNDTARKAAEKDLKQQEVLNSLQLQVANLSKTVEMLLSERTSVFRQMVETHICLMVIEAIIMITIMSLCVRRIYSTPQIPPLERDTVVSAPRLSKRRSSVDSCTPPIARKVKKRSASEEALNAGENLLIVEPLPVFLDPTLKVKKRNRKRNKAIQRSISHPTVEQKNSCSSSQCNKEKDSHSEACILSHMKSKHVSNKAKYVCENCNYNSCIVMSSERERRLDSLPLKNLTNGTIFDSNILQNKDNLVKGREKFSFRKFLKLQKRDSI
ncbi:SUN domain-containing ossification factor-like [Stegodyphus dumicola]|uniref:SUN domain-containing ossification factor-like n=1 Tax=Stegodyphus dumicola TaxID=202533 RepID=UPI0015A84368|nr:SUN domain-containing ossification factor-like [Stegodyphus dumicola]